METYKSNFWVGEENNRKLFLLTEIKDREQDLMLVFRSCRYCPDRGEQVVEEEGSQILFYGTLFSKLAHTLKNLKEFDRIFNWKYLTNNGYLTKRIISKERQLKLLQKNNTLTITLY